MSLDSLNVLCIIVAVAMCAGMVSTFVSLLLCGSLAGRAYDRYLDDAKTAGVDMDMDDDAAREARKAFAASSESFTRYRRREDAVRVWFVASISVAVLAGLAFATASTVYSHRYQGAVVNTLTESYGVSVDSRSKGGVPREDEAISTGLLLRMDGQVAQCTVATGYSPADLTVVCGGREIKPRH